MEFEWDEAKNAENFQKHRVKFEEAAKAFADENAVELFDELNSESEIRFQIIAFSPARLLFVSFTIREEKIRIISARKADAKQTKTYNEYKR